jgi:hypothetical protein
MIDYKMITDLIGKYFPNPQAIQLNQWIDQLRKENQDLRNQVDELKNKNKELNTQAVHPTTNIPICPNCSTTQRKQYMSPIPKDFVLIEGNTHECNKCGYKTNHYLI